MINEKHKFIFIHIPKTGGTSIEKLFSNASCRWDWTHNLWKQHRSIWQLKEIYKIPIDDYYKFTVVRNPWDKAVSGYTWWTTSKYPIFRNVKSKSLKDYLLVQNGFEKFNHLNNKATGRGDHFNTQYSFVEINGDCQMDCIIKFENLQEDFNIICDKIGIPQQKLPHKNKTNHKHYTEYYNEETKQIVAEKYAKDIEYFGYEFGE
jgi:hypothetical protein